MVKIWVMKESKEAEMMSKVFDLSNWKDGVSITRGGNDREWPSRPGIWMKD